MSRILTARTFPHHTGRGRYGTVFVDFGGVLSPPIEDLFLDYERKTGISPAQLKAAMASVANGLGVDVLAPVELGLISEVEWVERMHRWLVPRGVDVSRSEPDFGAQWFAGHQVNTAVRDLVIDLSGKGYRVGILTNNVREWEPYWRRMVDLDDHVDVIVDSYAVGVRKPDPEIFRIAEERIGAAPGTSILVDDLGVNCEAARSAGWGAVRFGDTDQAVADLRELLSVPAQAPGALQVEVTQR
ncbi:HAD family phosphatase [Rhodococcus triatomae]|uniref:Putative hydrolase of the HAD superfamily n=1 Tax=Rhodococcus triatomae TaxID=300028 RepID=A0A1G8LD02_9NOCA|nr:HAD family phosphatase [Rhodococcus triatomae]QNG20563.1 HAD family phosphatase [Rhodococcus triatomae]QNG23519.1 HAD family phosphatase [Rhodococcus triatomae]SDI53594.1 putative hydrolase of the HAD superfamily [Rhodococcus triatomae]